MKTFEREIESWRLENGDFASLLVPFQTAVRIFDPGFNPDLRLAGQNAESKPYEYVRTTYRYGDRRNGIRVVHTEEHVEAGSITLSADTFQFTPYSDSTKPSLTLSITRPPNHGWHQCRVEIRAEGTEREIERLEQWVGTTFGRYRLTEQEIHSSLVTATFFIMRGGWATAMRSIQPVLEQTKDNPKAFLLAGIARAGLDDLEGAEDYLRKTLDLKPEEVDALYNLGVCLVRKKMLKEALDCFLTGVRIDPENHPCWYELGATYEMLKMNDKAADAYRRSIELSPNPNGAFGYVGIDCTERAREGLTRVLGR